MYDITAIKFKPSSSAPLHSVIPNCLSVMIYTQGWEDWVTPSIHLISWLDVFSSLSGTGTLTVTNPIWVIKTRLCLQYTGSPAAVTQAPQYKGMLGKKNGKWNGQLDFRKNLRDCYQGQGKHWPIANWRVPSNVPRTNCGTHFVSSSLVVSKMVNGQTGRFTGWMNGLKNSGLVNFIPESCLLFVLQISSIYRKTAVKAWNYSRLPITRTFNGNRKKFELSGVWRK